MVRTLARLALVAVAALAPSIAAAQDNPMGSCKTTEPIRMLSQTPETIEGRPGAVRWTLTGNPVVIVCDDSTLMANKIVYESDTKAIWASGDVVLQQPDLTLSAERAEMDGKTKLGTFYNAAGLARLGDGPPQKSPFGTLEPDVTFAGEVIEKVAYKTYKLHHGRFTTCAQPTPRWEVTMGDATITLDKHAVLRGAVLRVKDVPLLYLPAFYYPMDKQDRSTGFLLPTYGASTLLGASLSNAFFWAIDRSQDATFFHDWRSKSGQGFGTEYRYIHSPNSRGNTKFYVFDTPASSTDGETEATVGRRSIQIDGDANQGLPRGFRVFGRLNLFTDAATQQLYQDVYDSSQRQQRSFNATVNGGFGRARLAATFDQSDYFYGENGQRNGRLPSVNVSIPDRAVGKSKIYVGTTGEAAYLVRQDDLANPATDHSLWRFNNDARVRAPLSSLSFLTVTTDASWHLTHWMESLDVTDPDSPLQVPVGLTRNLLEMSAQVSGPTFSRIFQTPNNTFASRFKHVIEPTVGVSRTTAFTDFDRVVQNDYSVDRQLGGVTRVDYGLANKVLARLVGPPAPAGAPVRPGITRQILSVNIHQSYYSNSLAKTFDSQYQAVSSESPFSPVRLQASARPTDTVTGEFSMEIDHKYHAVTTLAASSRLDFEQTQVSVNWSLRPKIESLQAGSHFLGGSAAVRSRNNHLGGSYRFNLDVGNLKWVQQRFMGYYNSQCCGVSFDYQTMDIPLWTSVGVPTNHQFSLSFTLAGVGSFSNPLGSFGGGR